MIFQLTLNRNYLNETLFSHELRHNLEIKNYTLQYLNQFGVVATNALHQKMYYFYNTEFRKISTDRVEVSSANSIYHEYMRNSKNHSSKVHYLNTDSFSWIDGLRRILKILLPIAVAYYTYRRFKTYDFNTLLTKNTPPTLITTFPRVSIFLEEVVKCFPFLGWRLIAFLERLKNGNWNTYNWHKSSMSMWFFERLKYHREYARKCPKTLDVIDQYNDYSLHGIKPHYPEGLPIPVGDSFLKPRQHPLPKLEERAIPKPYVPLHDPKKFIDDRFNRGIYPVMYAVSSMVRMAPTDNNKNGTIYERITRWDNTTTKPYHIPFLETLYKTVPHRRVKITNWAQTLRPLQRTRLKQSIDELTVHHYLNQQVSCSIKGDETINGSDKSIARLIFDLSGQDFKILGHMTAEFTEGLKAAWAYHGNGILTHNKYHNHIYFACGSRSSELDYFVNSMIDNDLNGQLVMGDDTFAIATDVTNQRIYIENDFSRYDRTHNKTLRGMVDKGLIAVSPYIGLWRSKMYSKHIKMSNGRGNKRSFYPLLDLNKIHDSDIDVDQLMTGEPSTCYHNSVTNAVVTTYIVSKYTQSQYIQSFEDCGLICRGMQVKDTPVGISFLKGFFLPGTDKKLHWIRSPCFLAKFGKCLKPLHEIVHHVLTLNEKSLVFLKSQWLGYGNMRTNWFYCAIDDELTRITRHTKHVIKSEDEPWKVFSNTDVYIDDTEWNSFLLSRYKLDVSDQLKYLDILKQIDSHMLPCVYSSNFVDTVIAHDY